MSEEEPFIRAILAAPEDRLVQLVYADWLDERGDPRAEFIRLNARAAEITPAHDDAPMIRRRLIALRAELPANWFSLIGNYRASRSEPDLRRAEQVAGRLGRSVRYIDDQGYERDISAAAISDLNQSVAYVESRSMWRGELHDIKYHLHVRDGEGRESKWEVESYNPYFGCDVRFLEWFGDVILVIYREKHSTYVCRFGLDCPATFQTIEDRWVLDDSQLGHWGYEDSIVQRLSIPGLVALPPLSELDADRWVLLPPKTW